MIILIGSRKGGCGKSTISTNIAVALAVRGCDVVLVDADRQGTSSNWSGDRDEDNSNLPKVNCIQKFENIKETLIDLNTRYEYVVVDAAGRDSKELRTGLLAADIVIVPLKPSTPDVDTLPKMQEIISEAKDYNEKLKAFALITMGPTNPIISEIRETQLCIANFADLNLLDFVISDRKVYRDAISEGKGVVEMDNDSQSNKKAEDEINALVNHIIDQNK